MTNEQILSEAANRAKNSEIHLGTANGWGNTTNELYAALNEVKVPNSGSSRNLGRCYNEYSYDVIINEQTYTVVYTVDSGD
jgi:hypothetical protein